MILDISDAQFKRIFANSKFNLPIRWDNKNFVNTLQVLFDNYISAIIKECEDYSFCQKNRECVIREVKRIPFLIVKTIKEYLNGFPAKAYNIFSEVMHLLNKVPLQIYHKSVMEHFDSNYVDDPLALFRIVGVEDNVQYGRTRVFHTPYSLRSKVATNRYGIAGFPSLYLATSLKLCAEELRIAPEQHLYLASRFQLARNFQENNIEIKVIELGIKPQDFFVEGGERTNTMNAQGTRFIDTNLLLTSNIRSAYLLWYPLIAACSFIRVNKKDPFSVEYVIPQLLMQWVRNEMAMPKCQYDKLIGIRYFSCASERASELGYNYVFPTSGKRTSNSFCRVLSKAFKLTKPHFLHEYANMDKCEAALRKDVDMQYI